MKAVRYYAPRDVRFDDVPEPPAPGPLQVLVAPLVAGLCGTDVKEYVGPAAATPAEPHPLTGAQRPVILGHEFSARVVDTGAGVSHVSPGDLVAVLPLETCGACRECRTGRPLVCERRAFTGLTGRWGGLGDRALLAAGQVFPVGDLTEQQACLVEPAAVSLNAVFEGRVRAGDRVLVIGCGPIGLLAVMAAIAAGATFVAACDPNAGRAARATAAGASAVVGGPDASNADIVRALFGTGSAPDVAIDCAGRDGTLNLAIAVVRSSGVISVAGVHRGHADTDVRRIARTPVTVVGSLAYTADVYERTIGLIAAGRLPVDQIVTSRIRREDIVPRGFEALTALDSAEVKVLVDVGSRH